MLPLQSSLFARAAQLAHPAATTFTWIRREPAHAAAATAAVSGRYCFSACRTRACAEQFLASLVSEDSCSRQHASCLCMAASSAQGIFLPDIHLLYASGAIVKARSFASSRSAPPPPSSSQQQGANQQHQGGSSSWGQQQLSTSLPLSKSPGNSGLHAQSWQTQVTAELNRQDDLGRTVLHKAVTSPSTIDWVRLLVAIPAVNVNAQDRESGWTPLHR